MRHDALLEPVLEFRVVIAPADHPVFYPGGAETIGHALRIRDGQSEAERLEGGSLDLRRVAGEEFVQEQLRVSAAGGPVAVRDL